MENKAKEEAERTQDGIDPMNLGLLSKLRILPPPPLPRIHTMGQNLPQVVVPTRPGAKVGLSLQLWILPPPRPSTPAQGDRILRKVQGPS